MIAPFKFYSDSRYWWYECNHCSSFAGYFWRDLYDHLKDKHYEVYMLCKWVDQVDFDGWEDATPGIKYFNNWQEFEDVVEDQHNAIYEDGAYTSGVKKYNCRDRKNQVMQTD